MWNPLRPIFCEWSPIHDENGGPTQIKYKNFRKQHLLLVTKASIYRLLQKDEKNKWQGFKR
jgi:hypothetical protein